MVSNLIEAQALSVLSSNDCINSSAEELRPVCVSLARRMLAYWAFRRRAEPKLKYNFVKFDEDSDLLKKVAEMTPQEATDTADVTLRRIFCLLKKLIDRPDHAVYFLEEVESVLDGIARRGYPVRNDDRVLRFGCVAWPDYGDAPLIELGVYSARQLSWTSCTDPITAEERAKSQMTDVDSPESEDDFSDALVGSDAEGEIAGVLVDEQRHQQRAAGRTPLANAADAKKIMASRGRATKLVGKVRKTDGGANAATQVFHLHIGEAIADKIDSIREGGSAGQRRTREAVYRRRGALDAMARRCADLELTLNPKIDRQGVAFAIGVMLVPWEHPAFAAFLENPGRRLSLPSLMIRYEALTVKQVENTHFFAGYDRVIEIVRQQTPLDTLNAAQDAAALEVLAEMVALWMVSDNQHQRYTLAQWARLLQVCYVAPSSCTPESIASYAEEYLTTSLFNQMLVRTRSTDASLIDLAIVESITPEQRVGCDIKSIEGFRAWVNAEKAAARFPWQQSGNVEEEGEAPTEPGPLSEFSRELGRTACRNCGAKAHRTRACPVSYDDALSKDQLLKKYPVVAAYVRKVMRP